METHYSQLLVQHFKWTEDEYRGTISVATLPAWLLFFWFLLENFLLLKALSSVYQAYCGLCINKLTKSSGSFRLDWLDEKRFKIKTMWRHIFMTPHFCLMNDVMYQTLCSVFWSVHSFTFQRNKGYKIKSWSTWEDSFKWHSKLMVSKQRRRGPGSSINYRLLRRQS